MEQVDRVKAEQIRQHVQLSYGFFRKQLVEAVECGAYNFVNGAQPGYDELSPENLNITFSDTDDGVVLHINIPLSRETSRCPALASWRRTDIQQRINRLYEDMLKLRNRWIDHFGRDAKLNLKALVDPSLLDGLPF